MGDTTSLNHLLHKHQNSCTGATLEQSKMGFLHLPKPFSVHAIKRTFKPTFSWNTFSSGLKLQVSPGTEPSGNSLHTYFFKVGGKKPKRNFSSLGLIMFKEKSSFLYQASIWAVPRIPISKSMNLAAFYLIALKGSSTLSIIHFVNVQNKGKYFPYVCHMFHSGPIANS